MLWRAHFVPDRKPTGGIESSPGELVIEFEAPDKDAALAYCIRNRLRYIGPLPDLALKNGRDAA